MGMVCIVQESVLEIGGSVLFPAKFIGFRDAGQRATKCSWAPTCMLQTQGGSKAFDLETNQRGIKSPASRFTNGKQRGDTLKAPKDRVWRHLLCSTSAREGRAEQFAFWESKGRGHEARQRAPASSKALSACSVAASHPLGVNPLSEDAELDAGDRSQGRGDLSQIASDIAFTDILGSHLGTGMFLAAGHQSWQGTVVLTLHRSTWPVMALPEHGQQSSALLRPGMC